MTRAAAKNHAWVTILTSPDQYPAAPRRAARERRNASAPTRAARSRSPPLPAPPRTTPRSCSGCRPTSCCPGNLVVALERTDETLRYGENPHQQGARYRRTGTTSWWDGVEQHAGLALSYLNYLRRRRGLEDRPRSRRRSRRVAIIKHANPCGVALDASLERAYQRALECDERSAFGGIVALNRPIDTATVERMIAGPQADLVIAPGYEAGHDRGAARQAEEHAHPRGPAAPAKTHWTSARSPAASSSRTRTTSRRRATTGAS